MCLKLSYTYMRLLLSGIDGISWWNQARLPGDVWGWLSTHPLTDSPFRVKHAENGAVDL